ncbi:hypothetical protein [Streptosporangium sandarakinum]|uniref:hypothetical protein n=1 Tax=Streptosporangium sandarakinum TaxID=1260955 RepID=UPI00368A32B8
MRTGRATAFEAGTVTTSCGPLPVLLPQPATADAGTGMLVAAAPEMGALVQCLELPQELAARPAPTCGGACPPLTATSR